MRIISYIAYRHTYPCGNQTRGKPREKENSMKWIFSAASLLVALVGAAQAAPPPGGGNVPEPGTLGLMSTALVGLLVSRRRTAP